MSARSCCTASNRSPVGIIYSRWQLWTRTLHEMVRQCWISASNIRSTSVTRPRVSIIICITTNITLSGTGVYPACYTISSKTSLFYRSAVQAQSACPLSAASATLQRIPSPLNVSTPSSITLRYADFVITSNDDLHSIFKFNSHSVPRAHDAKTIRFRTSWSLGRSSRDHISSSIKYLDRSFLGLRVQPISESGQ